MSAHLCKQIHSSLSSIRQTRTTPQQARALSSSPSLPTSSKKNSFDEDERRNSRAGSLSSTSSREQ